MTLNAIHAPHDVKNRAKVRRLARAYKKGMFVNPAVVLDFEDMGPQAITGSHRLAAMRDVFDDDKEVSELGGYVLVVDGDQVYEDARRRGDRKAIKHLEDMSRRKKGYYFGDLVDAIMPYVGENVQHALRDQGSKGKKLRRANDQS